MVFNASLAADGRVTFNLMTILAPQRDSAFPVVHNVTLIGRWAACLANEG